MSSYRKERVGDLLLAFLGDEVRRLADPRIQWVTLTGIDVAPDLKSAKVYWSLASLETLNDDRRWEDTHSDVPSRQDLVRDGNGVARVSMTGGQSMTVPNPEIQIKRVGEALAGAAKFLKRRVGEELRLRYVPDVRFCYDESVVKGFRMERLLEKIKQ